MVPMKPFNITPNLAKKIIAAQFPEYAHLSVSEVKQQGHDNKTYRIGDDRLLRMPVAESYALAVFKEQEFLPKLAEQLSIAISKPVKMGAPSVNYPYPFSIYKWIEGQSANLVQVDDKSLENIAIDLASFLKELQGIKHVEGPKPGQHNWWRGEHISVYDKGTREQITHLVDIIDAKAALDLWERASTTQWLERPVWIHGDFAAGNILIQDNRLAGVIDFGGMAVGDPACDLVIAWTYLIGKSREIFINEMALDDNTWLRARAWALWKATFEISQIKNKDCPSATVQKKIIDSLLSN